MIEKKFRNQVKRANLHPFNRHCLGLLRQEKAPHPANVLYSVSLMIWGLGKGLQVLHPILKDELEKMVQGIPSQVMHFLDLESLSQEDSPLEQAKDLLDNLHSQATERIAGYPQIPMQNLH